MFWDVIKLIHTREGWPVALILWGAIGTITGNAIYQKATHKEVQFTVDRPVEGGGESKFLIFTKDKNGNEEVFENSDSFWNWKWNSSDLQSQIKPGATYSAKIYGKRIRPLSMYRNILSLKEINIDSLKYDKAEMQRLQKIQELEKELKELKR